MAAQYLFILSPDSPTTAGAVASTGGFHRLICPAAAFVFDGGGGVSEAISKAAFRRAVPCLAPVHKKKKKKVLGRR